MVVTLPFGEEAGVFKSVVGKTYNTPSISFCGGKPLLSK